MRVRQGKPEAKLRLTKPRVFRQWKLGSEPPQFGDLSVTEAQIYLATDSDVEAIFLDEDRGHSRGFWAKTDPVYDPHRLVTSADALNRPYIGMQIAIPAQWVEVTVRYSKQTTQTLAKLGRTGRRGYRAVEEQIRSRRERRNPADPDIAASCGPGNDIPLPGIPTIGQADWLRYWRVLSSSRVVHVLPRYSDSLPDRQPACIPDSLMVVTSYGDANYFPPETPIPLETDITYCPRCAKWIETSDSIVVRGTAAREDVPEGEIVSFSTPHCPACKGRYDDPEVLCTYDISHSSWTCNRPLVAALLTGATINASDYSKIIITGVSTKLPVFLLTKSKAHLPTILQQAGLTTSRARARAGINDGSVTIEGWPSIAHRHTFKSEDLNGKTLIIGGIPALRFTAQVGDDSLERTDS